MKPPFEPSDTLDTYKVAREVTEAEILDMAHQLAEKRLSKGSPLNSPAEVRRHLQTLLHAYEHEIFGIIHLDTQHVVLNFELLFRGTIDAASVYPREVVKAALAINAAAVIFVHNHPSGNAEPSLADHRLTKRLVDALGTVDIKVIDHFVVGADAVISFAERGLL